MKKVPSTKKEFLFGSKNYRMLLIAISVIALGFVLMTGGGSNDPAIFNSDIFNFQRIRLAPTLVLIGFGLAMYSILLNGTKNE